MKKIAIFPGSFDPITIGHVDVVKRAAKVFDEIVVAIGVNTQKKYLFDLEERTNWIKKVFANETNVRVETYQGLTVNFCKEIGANYIIRGIRSSADFEYEKTIADANRQLDNTIETIFLTGEPKYTSVASTIVRDIIRNGGNASHFLPDMVYQSLPKAT